VNEADQLEALGELRDAARKYEQALSLIPTMQCVKEHVFVLQNVFQSSSVIPFGKELRRNGQLSLDGYLSVIWSALRTRDFETSREFLEEAYEKYPGEPGVLLYMEALLDAVDNNSLTLKEKLERSHKLSPNQVLPLIALSRIQRLAGSQASADELAHEAVKAAQYNLLSSDRGTTVGFWNTIPEKYFHLAMALYEASYSDRTLLWAAYESLKAALALEPDLPGGNIYLTSLLIDLDQSQSALEYSKHAHVQTTIRAWISFQRSRAYLYGGNSEMAKAEIDLAHREHLARHWTRWFSAVIEGEELPLEPDALSIFPFTSESVLPPLLYQFNGSHSHSGGDFSDLSRELFHINRKVRQQAAIQLAAYHTESVVQVLKPFLSKYRGEVTEDFLSDSGFSGAAMLLQYVPELLPLEISRIQEIINTGTGGNLLIGLQLANTHGAQFAQFVPSLRSLIKRAMPDRSVLKVLVKTLSAIPTSEAETVLIELAEMNGADIPKEYILEALQYRSLSNAAIDKYLEKVSEKAPNVEGRMIDASVYRKLRRKMVQAVASQK
jgi:tetratricopeptide (TPR) repeat protein